MADLLDVLPGFDIRSYSHLFHSFEKNDVTVLDLIALDATDIVKKCPLPLKDVRRLASEVIHALSADVAKQVIAQQAALLHSQQDSRNSSRGLQNLSPEETVIKTLDVTIDAALGSGIRPGFITEVVGESAAGKTQFVMSLLLTVQLPPPQGLGKSAIYISTESPLNTSRLHQMLTSQELFYDLPEHERPSLERVHTMSTSDLEAQEHVIQYQLPLAVKKFDVGLVVMDSVAANFRAEHETRTPAGLAERASDLVRLGKMLRQIATEDHVAVVVTNQVADRFDDAVTKAALGRILSSSPGAGFSPAPHLPMILPLRNATQNERLLSLDHQQRFFTGWEGKSQSGSGSAKNPAMGLAWANQISARVALTIEGDLPQVHEYTGGNIWASRKRRRFLNVVFAPWTAPTAVGVEYEIAATGFASVKKDKPVVESMILGEEMKDLEAVFADEDEEFP